MHANRTFLKSINIQNFTLTIASCFFYAVWDVRFLGLIFINIANIYVYTHLPLFIRESKISLTVGILIPLTILLFFKYYNFFTHELSQLLSNLGFGESQLSLNIILPIGVSFYTFQAISLIVDFRRGQLGKAPSLLEISAFLSFFPQLVAGPIERATNFIPQLRSLATPDRHQLISGITLVLIGLSLKIGVADVLGDVVDPIFAQDPRLVGGGDHAAGLILFSIQIYADFCGYSTIAIGIAKLFGFELMTNFRTPYFAPTLKDFWQRWHISLSTFFRDYVYIPIGGSKRGSVTTYSNLFLTFVISGLWHGSNWTFVAWGGLHGFAIVVERLLKLDTPSRNLLWRTLYYVLVMVIVIVSWEFFRAPSMTYAIEALTRIATDISKPTMISYLDSTLALVLCLAIDTAWHNNPKLEKAYGYRQNSKIFGAYQISVFTFAFWMLVIMAYRTHTTPFVYFQF